MVLTEEYRKYIESFYSKKTQLRGSDGIETSLMSEIIKMHRLLVSELGQQVPRKECSDHGKDAGDWRRCHGTAGPRSREEVRSLRFLL